MRATTRGLADLAIRWEPVARRGSRGCPKTFGQMATKQPATDIYTIRISLPETSDREAVAVVTTQVIVSRGGPGN